MSDRIQDTNGFGANAAEAMRGPIAWMAKNRVAANLLMVALIVGGLLQSCNVKQEVFPEFELEMVSIAVPYPGATPEEVEQGILLSLEEAVQGVDGVKQVTSVATESMGRVQVELLTSADPDQVLGDIKNEVDRIASFPDEAEEPIVSQPTNRYQVISVVIYGDQPHATLRAVAEEVRSELIALDDILLVELGAVPPPEISIEVPRRVLRAYGLTLDQVAGAVRAGSVELTGGSVRTEGGEILVRTDERSLRADEFADITVFTTPQGGRIRLGDIADVRETYALTDQEATYNSMPAVKVDVFRVGNQTPNQVAAAVKEYIDGKRRELPPSIDLSTWEDNSEIFVDRINLLVRNGIIGLILVFFVLGGFLELRLAGWVMLGIPISFLGSFLLFPMFDVSINMISLFAFIVALGIVVDDAIVVGENIFYNRQQGMKLLPAAIQGARQVAVPVVFAVLTSVAAFSPLLFVPGFAGNFFRVIPIIVISVLVLSLVESLVILPAHLGHSKREKETGIMAALRRPQKRVSKALEWFIDNVYARSARLAVHFRYATVAAALALLLISIGFLSGGHLPFLFMPKIESDMIIAQVRLPVGASIDESRRVRDLMTGAAHEVVSRHGDYDKISRGVYSQIGTPIMDFGPSASTATSTGAHSIDMVLWLVGPEERNVRTATLAAEWRELVGMPTGARTVKYMYSTGPGTGPAINVQLEHPSTEVLELAAADLAELLKNFTDVTDVDPGFANGKPQLDLSLTPAGRAAGLTEFDMARQVRSAFFGAEALRQQRGRDEVRVMVRLPEEDRERLYGLEQFRLRTPSGQELPLEQAAYIEETRAYTSIVRVHGQRVLSVTADVEETATPGLILGELRKSILPDLMTKYDGLKYSFEGDQADMQESTGSLFTGFLFALLVIYALLAVPFRSYIQPLIVMTAIPFGFIGAIAGHLLLGFNMSIISMMGLVALAGVVVNNSLVLIVMVNDLRAEGLSAYDAVMEGGKRRFRPIVLTSLTTFFGLAPLIFETSMQARFLIPMAISLGFGVIFSTAIILMLVPAIYIAVEDARGLFSKKRLTPDKEVESAQSSLEPASARTADEPTTRL